MAACKTLMQLSAEERYTCLRHKIFHYLSSNSRALLTSGPEHLPGAEHVTKAEADADD